MINLWRKYSHASLIFLISFSRVYFYYFGNHNYVNIVVLGMNDADHLLL